jgi:hypothetical protein
MSKNAFLLDFFKLNMNQFGCMYSNDGKFYVLLSDGFYRWSNEHGTEVNYIHSDSDTQILHKYDFEKENMYILRKSRASNGYVSIQEEVIEKGYTGSFIRGENGSMHDEKGHFFSSDTDLLRSRRVSEKIESIKKIIEKSHEQHKRHSIHGR